MEHPILTPPILAVGPDKFLFDYKILIFALIILVLSIMLACKKKSWRNIMIPLLASDILVTLTYVFNRIYDTSVYGYRYFLETNNDFRELISFIVGMVIVFFVLFLGDKVIKRFKGGK
ncbi:MAG: hypothetical protein IJX99_09890 [Clostridia bacterium]|nr:hypothetical protein [Clostridia bacterium]